MEMLTCRGFEKNGLVGSVVLFVRVLSMLELMILMDHTFFGGKGLKQGDPLFPFCCSNLWMMFLLKCYQKLSEIT